MSLWRLADEADEMLAYERRARWIRRMQHRAERRRQRAWSHQSGFAAPALRAGSGWGRAA